MRASRTVALVALGLLACGVAACGASHRDAAQGPVPSGAVQSSPPQEAAPAPSASFPDELLRIVDAAPGAVSVIVLPFDEEGSFLVQEKATSATRLSFRPGSTVKPLLAMLAADAGALSPGAHRTCLGAHREDGLTCFAEHGDLELARAIAVSCNAYFYDVAGSLGSARVLGGFRELGFGKATGLATHESTGFVGDEVGFASEAKPDPERDAKVIGIGHGAFEATPLQLAVAYRTLAQRLREERGQHTPRAEVYAEIERGLEAAVRSDEGTARGAQVSGLDVVGKTGTAEAHPYGAADEGFQNGWFAGYAPKDSPELVVVVLLPNAPHGGKDAALIAGRVFDAWQRARAH